MRRFVSLLLLTTALCARAQADTPVAPAEDEEGVTVEVE
jgi:hypothetical protein